MNSTWSIKILFILVFVCLISFSNVYSYEDNDWTRSSLRGLKEILVVIESLPPEVENKETSTSQIQVDVELKLRMAGIRVIPTDELKTTPGHPILVVQVALLKQPMGLFSNVIRVGLVQEVNLERDQKISIPTMTWEKIRHGLLVERDFHEIRNHIKDLTDHFINAYLSVNPKGGK